MTTELDRGRERRRLRVGGVVQGVGFRPHVHRLAVRHGLCGSVLNDADGVLVDVEGPPEALDSFVAALRAEAPAAAQVDAVVSEHLAPRGVDGFSIVTSVQGAGAGAVALVPADLATCADCLRELFDPADRRFRHPFISCTQCGPRLTVVESVPYDRERTTMAGFAMCAACRAEYEDPADRRFHAEPIACHSCGPRLSMPLDDAVALLRDGGVLAVKGLGGWHLACDAGDERAVARLRTRKQRDDKPFAVMAADPAALVELDDEETEVLHGPERPILLARRRPDAPIAGAVAPGTPWLGVMAPYSPLHHLLVHDAGRPLVMTSGNRSDEPIAVADEQARTRLGAIADAFLGHDRPIARRCEDSVMRRGALLRRSRGFVPRALRLPVAAARPVVAAGAELKATFCVARGRQAVMSSHLGDLHSAAAWEAFAADLRLLLDMLEVEPAVVAHDLHLGYRSTAWALEQGLPAVAVQHHHAHAAACLAEHGETGPAMALVFDGTGLGSDGTLWGGELLHADLHGFERLAHLEAVPLPGGEAAIREPWRMAAVHLERSGRPVPFERWPLVSQSLRVNAPLSSGMGRLFDAVAALLGVRHAVSYEGQAAIELELLAGETPASPYSCRMEDGVIMATDLVAAAHDDLHAGRPTPEIAAAFHEGVAAAAATACAQARAADTVVLSGGTFQNLRLAGSVRRRLEEHGFRVLTHRRVPANDGGISFGQAAVAARRLSSCA